MRPCQYTFVFCRIFLLYMNESRCIGALFLIHSQYYYLLILLDISSFTWKSTSVCMSFVRQILGLYFSTWKHYLCFIHERNCSYLSRCNFILSFAYLTQCVPPNPHSLGLKEKKRVWYVNIMRPFVDIHSDDVRIPSPTICTSIIAFVQQTIDPVTLLDTYTVPGCFWYACVR